MYSGLFRFVVFAIALCTLLPCIASTYKHAAIPIEFPELTCWFNIPGNVNNSMETLRLYSPSCPIREIVVAKRLIVERNDTNQSQINVLPASLFGASASNIRSSALIDYSSQGRGISVYLVEFADYQDVFSVLQSWHQLGKRSSDAKPILSLQPDLIVIQQDRLRKNPLAMPLAESPVGFDAQKHHLNSQLWGSNPGQGINIAVIDDGFYLNHPFFCNTKVLASWDVDMGIPGAVPDQGYSHGSQVAAIIFAQRPNTKGCPNVPALPAYESRPDAILGMAHGANMIALKLTRPWLSKLLLAFNKAELHQADVVNNSWLLDVLMPPLRRYLDYLTLEARGQTGIAVVAAARPSFHANIGLSAYQPAIVVSAVDYKGRLANASWGDSVDIAALGFPITADFSGEKQYSAFLKTSAAVPIITSVVAIMRSKNPSLSVAQLEGKLKAAAIERSIDYEGKSYRWRTLDYEQLAAMLSNN